MTMTNAAFEIIAPIGPSRWTVTCDHASNQVPASVSGGSLGLPPEDMQRHIAYDIGAAGVARALSTALNGHAILSRFSRLVIDLNRGEDDPTLIMKVYDRTIIPANRALSQAERNHRIESFYRPYHAALANLAAEHETNPIVAVHSFTPQLSGRAKRPWHVGILTADQDRRLSDPLLDRLRAMPDLCVGENEPYVGHLPGDSIDQHALANGRPNTLIEIRNDLIEHPDQQEVWAQRLATALEGARRDAKL